MVSFVRAAGAVNLLRDDMACKRPCRNTPVCTALCLLAATDRVRFCACIWLGRQADLLNVMQRALQSCAAPLQTAVRKSAAMLHSGAFVHQYERFGLCKPDLQHAMYNAQEVVAAYEAM